MIQVQVEAVCDWCGLRKPVDPNTGYVAVADWEAVVGELEERPVSLAEALAEYGIESELLILCPECRAHVAWDDEMALLAVDAAGEALRGSRAGAQR